MKTLLITLGMLMLSTQAFAVQWCRLEVKNASNNVLYTTTANRGDDFFDKKVTKIKDCDVCWSEGKSNGPDKCADYADSKEYVITCMKNSGKTKSKTFVCP